MSKIGTHVSIAGGIVNAPKRASDLGCETFQCFTRSPQGGPAPELNDTVIKEFKSQMAEFNMETFYIHTPYYINFASIKPKIRKASIRIVREELERGSVLGARYIMTHLGSHTGQSLEDGLQKVADAIKELLKGYTGSTGFLMEISAGTGNIIGDTFEEISFILKQVKNLKGFAGICFDTCHAFASGYDFRTTKKAKEVLKEFDKKIGLKYLKLSHINDSKVDLGGKKDRHEHIGDGYIGENGMASLLSTPEFKKIDWLLETEDSRREADIAILKKIRRD
ncbi:MAG: deoxyribonuclease IV [Candidatus Paceibacterota bacterium]